MIERTAHANEVRRKLNASPIKSMHIALQDLKLKRLFVVYPGKESYALERQVEVVSIQHLADKLALQR